MKEGHAGTAHSEWRDSVHPVGSLRGYEIHTVSNRDMPSEDTFVKNPTQPADLKVSMNGYVINGRIHAHMTIATPDKGDCGPCGGRQRGVYLRHCDDRRDGTAQIWTRSTIRHTAEESSSGVLRIGSARLDGGRSSGQDENVGQGMEPIVSAARALGRLSTTLTAKANAFRWLFR